MPRETRGFTGFAGRSRARLGKLRIAGSLTASPVLGNSGVSGMSTIESHRTAGRPDRWPPLRPSGPGITTPPMVVPCRVRPVHGGTLCRTLREVDRQPEERRQPPEAPDPSLPVSSRPSRDRRRSTVRDQVFISYSHQDERFLDELLTHLKPYLRTGITAWSDRQIQPGSHWFDEIKAALARTSVAVMLVSPDFLASDFIHEHELGPLLKEAEAGGVQILWVLIRDCSWKETPLKDYQAVVSRRISLFAGMKAATGHGLAEGLRRDQEGHKPPSDGFNGVPRHARRSSQPETVPTDETLGRESNGRLEVAGRLVRSPTTGQRPLARESGPGDPGGRRSGGRRRSRNSYGRASASSVPRSGRSV